MSIEKSIEYLLGYCSGLQASESALLLYDQSTVAFVPLFEQAMRTHTASVASVELPVANRHGMSLPAEVAAQMLDADLTVCLTLYSYAHSDARLEASKRGRRYLSLAGYNTVLLENPAVLFDYKGAAPHVKRFADWLSAASEAMITSEKGTQVTLNLEGRSGNAACGIVNQEILLGSPPDAEANIAPVEPDSQGVIIVDGSITHETIGLLKQPVALKIHDGKISGITSEDDKVARCFKALLQQQQNDRAYVLAELGIGFNDKAKLCGNMLVDEGVGGHIHFGFGANHTIQGQNKVAFHIDAVVCAPTLKLDGQTVIERGAFLV